MANITSTNFADRLLDAVKQVSGTDKENKTTYLCTITEVGSNGAYKVSYNGDTYDAYSNIPSYNVGDKVYMFVPDADFQNNQFFILGRQKVDKEDYIPVPNPFSVYVDTTGDLERDTDNNGPKSLLANHAVWSVPLETITVVSGYSFTRLGLKAQFKTNLKAKNAVRGSYGILVEVEYEYEEDKQKYLDSIFYDFKSSDMIGDTLNFEVFTEQNAVFDISEIKDLKGEIKGIYLTFYQDANFVDKNNQPLNKAQPIYSQGKATGKYRTYNENPKYNDDIMVKNVYVSLGYDENDYSTNTAIIYCAQDRDFSSFEGSSLSEDEKNNKNEKLIEARWIYHNPDAENDEDKIVAIDRASELPEGAQIYWFRHEPKYKVPEGKEDIGGYEWQGLLNDDAPDPLSFIFNPRKNKANEIVKCVIVYPTTSMCQSMIAEEKSLIDRSAYQTQADYDNQLRLIENKYKPQYFHSEPIQFTNIQPFADMSAANITKGLNIIVDWDNLKGSYYVYNSINEISATSLANESRILKASYKPIANDGISIEKDATKIVWQIPLINTMIAPPKNGEEYKTGEAEARWTETYELSEDKMFAIITREKPVDGQSLDPVQTFKIKSRYLQSATNNTVTCQITMRDKVYEAQTKLNFGQSGNNGANATFVLSIKDGMNAIEPVAVQNNADGSKVYKAQRLTVEGRIYDYKNNDVTQDYTSFKWDWYRGMNRTGDGKSLSITPGDNPNECYIDLVGDPYKALGYILKADVSYNVTDNVALNPDEISEIEKSNQSQSGENTVGSTYNNQQTEKRTIFLTAFLGIPINFNKESYSFVEAPDKIVYNTNGTNPTYYDDYLKIFKINPTTKKNEVVTQCEWVIGVDGDDGENEQWKKYYPEVQLMTEEYAPPPAELSINSSTTDTITTVTDDDMVISGVYRATITDKVGTNPVENAEGDVVYTMMEVTQKYSIINETTGESLSVSSGDDTYKLYEALLARVEGLTGYKKASASLSEITVDKYFLATFQFSNSDISDVETISYGGTFDNDTSANYGNSDSDENKKATAVFGPKIKAPNMYYSNLNGSVYLNCYAYYEKPDVEIDATTDPNYSYGSSTSTSNRTTTISIEDENETVITYTITGEGEVPEPDEDDVADTGEDEDVSADSTTDEEEGYDEEENGASYSDIAVNLEGDEDAYGNPLPVVGQRVLVWSQPLLIIQNRYPSAALNAWDGSLLIDEKGNKVMTSMVAAGYKESDNSYTGVVMGSVGSEISANTGVYGFHKGAQVYAFKDNGTAFLGKSGSGQIRFDGNKGIIQSGSYEDQKLGMILDLDGDPENDKGSYIEMAGTTAAVRIATNTPYFTITDTSDSKNHKSLIYIGTGDKEDSSKEGDYYLQTSDFDNTKQVSIQGRPLDANNNEIKANLFSGTKLNLRKNKFESYGDFTLLALGVDTNTDTGEVYKWDKGLTLSSLGNNKDGEHYFKISNGKTYNTATKKIYDDVLVQIDKNNMFFISQKYEDTNSGMKVCFSEKSDTTPYITLKQTYDDKGKEIPLSDLYENESTAIEPTYCPYCGGKLTNGACTHSQPDLSDGEIPNEGTVTPLTLADFNSDDLQWCLSAPLYVKTSVGNLPSNNTLFTSITMAFWVLQEDYDDDSGKMVINYCRIKKHSLNGETNYYLVKDTSVSANDLAPIYACAYCGVAYLGTEQNKTNYLVLNDDLSFVDMRLCVNAKCPFTVNQSNNVTNSILVTNQAWKVHISPVTPYFQIRVHDTGKSEDQGRYMVHVGDGNFQFISHDYNNDYANSYMTKGMKIRLNYGNASPYIHTIQGYYQCTNLDKVESGKYCRGKRDIVMSGEKDTSFPLYVRELTKTSASTSNGVTTVTRTYVPKFRVSWSGAVYARAYYLLDGNSNLRLFASGGDSIFQTRIPQYTFFKYKRSLKNITSWRTLSSKNYSQDNSAKSYKKQYADVSFRPT